MSPLKRDKGERTCIVGNDRVKVMGLNVPRLRNSGSVYRSSQTLGVLGGSKSPPSDETD